MLPTRDKASLLARGAVSAFESAGPGLEPVQWELLTALATQFYPDHSVAPGSVEPISAEELGAALEDAEQRRLFGYLVVVLEMILHPLPPDVEAGVSDYMAAAGIDVPFANILRDTANSHLALLHADLIRHSWTTEQTIEQIFKGQLLRLARSKLAYYGIGQDRRIARKWRATGDCPPGSWGRGVYDFYQVHGFPFPGEAHGIYEVGARHDWVHVITDYATDPEGEIDVFAFIAANMVDPKGMVNFLFTLALFQNATIGTVGGKQVVIARGDTLGDPNAATHLADAVGRGAACTVDIMGGIDPFDYKDEPLDELRERWGIPPKGPDARPIGAFTPLPGGFPDPGPNV